VIVLKNCSSSGVISFLHVLKIAMEMVNKPRKKWRCPKDLENGRLWVSVVRLSIENLSFYYGVVRLRKW